MVAARDRVEVVAGRTLFSPSPAAPSVTTIPLYPTSFSRLLSIADNFEYYRFTKLHVTLYPAAHLNDGVDTHVAYSNGTYDTPPATFAAMAELPFYAQNSAQMTIPSSFTVGRQELLADVPLKWFKTVPSSQDVPNEIQGNIYLALGGVNSTQIDITVEWVCELSQWNLAGQSPAFKDSSYECIDQNLGLYRRVSTVQKAGVGEAATGRPSLSETAISSGHGSGAVSVPVKRALEA